MYTDGAGFSFEKSKGMNVEDREGTKGFTKKEGYRPVCVDLPPPPPPPPKTKPNEESTQKKKPPRCMFYARDKNSCQKGSSCRFSHDGDDKNNDDNNYDTTEIATKKPAIAISSAVYCRHFGHYKCVWGNKCTYKHGSFEEYQGKPCFTNISHVLSLNAHLTCLSLFSLSLSSTTAMQCPFQNNEGICPPRNLSDDEGHPCWYSHKVQQVPIFEK
jgi:hypothetical protein